MNIAEYLADFLGVEESEVLPSTLLRDLGVDSLLSTELRSDIAGKFDVHIPDDVLIDEQSVKDMDMKINGQSGGAPKPVVASKSASATMPDIEKEMTRPANGITTAVSSTVSGFTASGNLEIKASTILEAFGETKKLTDQSIVDYRCADYMEVVNPKQTQLCISLTLDAFEQLGCKVRTMEAGQKLERIKYFPQHGRLVEYLYDMLEKEARLIDV